MQGTGWSKQSKGMQLTTCVEYVVPHNVPDSAVQAFVDVIGRERRDPRIQLTAA